MIWLLKILVLTIALPGVVMGVFALLCSTLADFTPFSAMARTALGSAPLAATLCLVSGRAALRYVSHHGVGASTLWELGILLFALLGFFAARLLGQGMYKGIALAGWTGLWTGATSAVGSCAGALAASLLLR